MSEQQKAVAKYIGAIRKDGELTATIQVVPNTITGKHRIEVYDPAGRLMAHQTLDRDCSDEYAAEIGFALCNGFIFGVEHTKYQMRKNFEAILLETPDLYPNMRMGTPKGELETAE